MSSARGWHRVLGGLLNPRSTGSKVGIIAFLVTFAVLASTTAGYAYWASSLSATSTLSVANLTLTTTNFSSVNYTFRNDTLVTTGSVTATNSTASTSTQAAAVTLTFGPNASTLAGKVTLTLWPTTSAANCTAAATVPGTATSALWSASTVITTTLAPSASAIYCVRSSIASRESVVSSGGTLTFTPTVSGTIVLKNFSSTASASATQSTSYIYPAISPDTAHFNWIRMSYNPDQNYCFDVAGGATSSGTPVIGFGCTYNGAWNRQFTFTPSGVAGYYTITPRTATGLRLDNGGSTSAALLTVNTAGTASTTTSQQWQLQQISSTTFEMVNALSGMCITVGSGSGGYLGQLAQTPCNGSVNQSYMLSQAFTNFTCSAANNAFTYAWDSVSTGPYQVIVTHGSTNTVVTTTAATASGATFPYSSVSSYGSGTYNLQFVDKNSTVVGTGTITFNGSPSSCTAYDFK